MSGGRVDIGAILEPGHRGSHVRSAGAGAGASLKPAGAGASLNPAGAGAGAGASLNPAGKRIWRFHRFTPFCLIFLAAALAGCPEKKPAAVDAGPAPSASSAADVDADANLPWATEIDMDAGASAPTPASTPTAVASAAPAPAFHGPTGTYTGNVKDSGQVYTITANLTATGATVSYSAPLNCKARWTFQSASPTSAPTTFKYVEKITEQPKPPTCADNVNVVLTKEPSLPNAYVYSAGGGQAQALLKKL